MINQDQQPLISIIVPVYNSSFFLQGSIDSVLAQTYTNWELILVDDHSSDNSAAIIKEYSDSDERIKPFYLEENQGAGFSRNVGLASASGDYIAFLDSDDSWADTKLEEHLQFMQENSVQFSYTWYYECSPEKEIINYFKVPATINRNLLEYNNYILTSTVLCTKEVLEGVRFPLLRRRQDWQFFLDILKKSGIAKGLSKKLTYYVKRDDSLSTNKLALIKPNFVFFKDHIHGGNSLFAALHFFVFIFFYIHNKVFNKVLVSQ